jgi:hypothetical protein
MLSINFGKAQDHCETYCNGGMIEGTVLQGMVIWVEKRVNKYLSEDNIGKSAAVERRHLRALKDHLTQAEITNILACLPENLLDKSREYQAYKKNTLSYSNSKGKLVGVNVLSMLFNYKAFREYKVTIYSGFTLAKELGIACCPYCNRNYTTTHNTYYIKKDGDAVEKRVYAEFDHFYGQAEHPLLGVSFYNLIPSCTVCNTHYKNNRDSSGLFHPHTLNDPTIFKFHGFPKDVDSLYGAGNEISLSFKYNCPGETEQLLRNSHDFFGIKDIYDKCHGDLIRDIIYKKLAFGERYMNELSQAYGMSFEDSYRIVFETHFEDENVNERPFTKLKKDIFESREL